MTAYHQRGDRHWTRRQPELIKRGSAAQGAKLTELDRQTIRALCEVPGANRCRVARLFGVTRVTIWRLADKNDL